LAALTLSADKITTDCTGDKPDNRYDSMHASAKKNFLRKGWPK